MSVTGKTEVAELVLERGIIFGDNAAPKQSVYEQSITANYLVGTSLVYSDGREYRYAKAGAVALAKALMCQSSIPQTELFEQDQTASYPAVGDTVVTVEIATGLTLHEQPNELAGGYLNVNKADGIGDTYKIIGSYVGTTDTNLSLVLDSPIRTAWTTSTEISIVASPWDSVIVQVEPATGQIVGVPAIAVDINYYFWLQTKGPVSIIVDATETLVIADLVGAPATQTTAGTAGTWVTLTKPWGTCMQANTTVDEPALVYLTLP